MFDIAYELGAETTIVNLQGLTTLTLAAQMAKKQMFFHILNINRDVYWRVGNEKLLRPIRMYIFQSKMIMLDGLQQRFLSENFANIHVLLLFPY